MTAPRKVMVLTGKRGGFGAMVPMLRLLRDDPVFELQLVVTDQHVSARFGNTVREVEEEFAVAAAVDMAQQDDRPASRCHALARCLAGMTDVLADLAPDLCVLYGDRGEVLATAFAATNLGVPIAHIQGGDVSGSVDEPVRHAVSKLAHVHFPATEQSASRLRQMGEEDWRIHVVGDNHIDSIVHGRFAPRDQVARALDLDLDAPVIVLLQHSETTAPDDAHGQMVETLAAVAAVGHQTVVVHPCSDQGYGGILRAIEEQARPPQFRVHVNIDAPLFWGLLAQASVMVGNSSAGLIETPSFRLPAVNVGRRQVGRLHAENVIHVGHDRGEIEAAIRRALTDPDFRRAAAQCSQPFGDGRAGERIVGHLRELEIDRRLRLKELPPLAESAA
ncbi:MAG: UDP-N-acetylglucosamine 2-epimerase (hydrolyzing) [Hyphomicrobiales bacterium]|nr:UDP-N-acetylglucosamine 2-epimerase (hydrolyzing) [Hyphomicrobiales bacterium]